MAGTLSDWNDKSLSFKLTNRITSVYARRVFGADPYACAHSWPFDLKTRALGHGYQCPGCVSILKMGANGRYLRGVRNARPVFDYLQYASITCAQRQPVKISTCCHCQFVCNVLKPIGLVLVVVAISGLVSVQQAIFVQNDDKPVVLFVWTNATSGHPNIFTDTVCITFR